MTSSETLRHLKALTLKNWATSKRQPVTTCCTLVCPGFLMLFMVWLRTLFATKTVDSAYLNLLKNPKFTVVIDADQTVDTSATDDQVNAFFEYTNYTRSDDLSGSYRVQDDQQGPLWFNPPNCNLNHSFVIP